MTLPFKIEEDAKLVASLINQSKYLVVFTGAGISTESGLSDFRGKNGIWTRRDKGLPPIRGKHFDEVKPNKAHLAIKQLQDMGILKFLISQNVDNLHLASGIDPKLIAELHGNYTLMKCLDCDSRFSRTKIGWNREIHGRGFRTEQPIENQPVCPNCKGRIISSVVNFNDPMPDKEMKLSKEHVSKCDLMIVVGSSLSVQPASNLPRKAKRNGAKVVIINIDPTNQDESVDLKLDYKAGEFLPSVIDQLNLLSN